MEEYPSGLVEIIDKITLEFLYRRSNFFLFLQRSY